MSDWIDAEQHADQAATLLESGRLAEAEAAFRRALAIDSDQPDWHYQLGRAMDARDITGETRTFLDARFDHLANFMQNSA
jgi:Flp pilus assembly protein TadD